jgi:D-glycero-D-manno-heptose 1,7-bisphosphate phosphatase
MKKPLTLAQRTLLADYAEGKRRFFTPEEFIQLDEIRQILFTQLTLMNPCINCPQAPEFAGPTEPTSAVFIDLDWTLIKTKSEATFPKHLDDWELMPGMIDALRPFWKAGFKILVISNQGGIEAGHHTEEEIEGKLFKVLTEVFNRLVYGQPTAVHDSINPNEYAGRIDYFYCPSFKAHPDRKPEPGLIFRAAEKHGIDLKRSLFVGDMESGFQASVNAGIFFFCYTADFLALGQQNFTLFQQAVK